MLKKIIQYRNVYRIPVGISIVIWNLYPDLKDPGIKEFAMKQTKSCSFYSSLLIVSVCILCLSLHPAFAAGHFYKAAEVVKSKEFLYICHTGSFYRFLYRLAVGNLIV